MRLNGREIKSLVKSAHLLGLKGGEKVGMGVIRMLVRNRVAAVEAFAGE